jgi:hypothetical protein
MCKCMCMFSAGEVAKGAGRGREPAVHPPRLRGVRLPHPPQDRVHAPPQGEREGVRGAGDPQL